MERIGKGQWIAWLVIATSACQRDAVGDGISDGTEDGSTAQADDLGSADTDGASSADSPQPGEAESSGASGGSEGDETGATEDPWQLCDAATLGERPADAGPCAGSVPSGELDAAQAEWIFGRATHEIDHVAEFVRSDPGESDLFESDGDDLQALSDSGYVIGHIVREEGTERACVTLSYACWTGGHGGFGASALDGRADVLIDGDVVEARGALGLTEGGALTGAPAAEVWARIENASVEGSVGAFEF